MRSSIAGGIPTPSSFTRTTAPSDSRPAWSEIDAPRMKRGPVFGSGRHTDAGDPAVTPTPPARTDKLDFEIRRHELPLPGRQLVRRVPSWAVRWSGFGIDFRHFRAVGDQ